MNLNNMRTIMKNKILILFIFLFTISSVYAKVQLPEITAANQAYTHEKYNDALMLYQKVIDKGMESSDLFFNMGNCYYRMSNYPMAIFYYEKAKKLNPADEDIEFNIKITNTKIVDKIEPIPVLFFIKWWILLTNIFSFDDWAILAIIAIFVFFTSLFFYLSTHTYKIKKLTFWLSVIFLFITLLSVKFAHTQYKNMNSKNTAIIFAPNVNVKSSPDEKGIDKFVIHEGTKVLIVDELNNWVKIKIANGSNGWIEKQTFEVI